MTTELLLSGPTEPSATLVLAHGAGAPMDHPWMTELAELLGDRGIRVARFEFGYIAARRTGTRKPPPRAEALLGEYRAVVSQLSGPLLIGGKSMGGRVASMVADELGVRGLVCLGYPFHPPGKPEQLRTAHLRNLSTPTLICQGTRDPFGTPPEVADYDLSSAITVRWFDGDHGLLPLKSAGIAQPLAAVADAVALFAASRS